MSKNFDNEFKETLERTYGSVDNFVSACDSYRAFYAEYDDHTLDMRKYTSDGVVTVVVESAIYYDGMVDINVFLDGARRGFVVCEEYSNEIMRVYDQLPEKAEITENDPAIHLEFLSGKLFLACVDKSIITYLKPLDVKAFEEHLRIMMEE